VGPAEPQPLPLLLLPDLAEPVPGSAGDGWHQPLSPEPGILVAGGGQAPYAWHEPSSCLHFAAAKPCGARTGSLQEQSPVAGPV